GHASGQHRPRQRVRPAHLDYVVHAAPAGELAHGHAPRAYTDTPPLPRTSTSCPGCSAPCTNSARQAVSPAVVSVAASAWLQPRGASVNAFAGAVTCSRA